MKKRDLWIVVGAVVCAVALLVGSQFIEKNTKQGTMGMPSGMTMEFGAAQPKAHHHSHSWLFASACAEETAEEPAQSAEETEPAPLNLDEETIAALEAWGIEAAESYLVVWMNDYFQPVPLLDKFDGQKLRIGLTEEDYNVVLVKKNGFDMFEASCPDQVCVTEGEVTLENREERILGSFIICMPNNIVLELQSAEELLELLATSVVE